MDESEGGTKDRVRWTRELIYHIAESRALPKRSSEAFCIQTLINLMNLVQYISRDDLLRKPKQSVRMLTRLCGEESWQNLRVNQKSAAKSSCTVERLKIASVFKTSKATKSAL